MQSLFSLNQSIEANHQLALDFIEHRFSPDLNSMQVQDRTLLAKQKDQATKLFEKSFEKKETTVDHSDSAIAEAVNEAFDRYTKLCKKDKDFFRTTMVADAERIYNHYIAVLCLALAFVDVAKADKKVNHNSFTSNAWIKAIQTSDRLKAECLRLNKSWDGRMDKVRTWFRDIVRQDAEYQIYQDKKHPNLDDQKKFANYFFRKIIFGKNGINDQFEEDVLLWAEDKDIVKGMVEKTIKAYDPDDGAAFALHSLSLNWDEDREFIERLYDQSVDLEQRNRDLIAKNTRNWEVERLPLTDKIILEMAIAEILNFPSIPVKVTINEYIELAKNYSTPKSRQFINGILDVIAKELKESGSVRKSGRGLIDNK
ncbi:MAG TPA: transcription antitermination factor NusB [Cyclobacteriaceae bacterium]|nr:transcription antitermination factor NusB [Cyclobacteriaceae bacterium]